MTVPTTTAAVAVCAYEDLLPERGVAALVGDRQVALFRTYAGDVYALANTDPFSGANVLSRGIVGSRGEVPTVASPMFKQVFDLRTGVCLDDPAVAVAAYAVEVVDGQVLVGLGAAGVGVPGEPQPALLGDAVRGGLGEG
ncbi:nitrite reductase small subunit NirD [Kribbella italica]|uniref:Nitrite reductase (NADH) small subunit n=1 Tax=Kribbella italica TaxID=1540520 RepID=A0A7W9JF52_9ACTN|nr:nitrite reductase small subunit NirD [Kribbella italica]MBB5840953.1 nitrite reductase (NADH) small subunit [Kribbella italica]